MYIGRDFDPQNTTESTSFGLDFVNDIQAGESIVTVNFVLTVFSGTDATPSSHLIGSSGLSGTIASQRVQFLLPSVTYTLAATVTTNFGNTYTLYSHIPCQPIL